MTQEAVIPPMRMSRAEYRTWAEQQTRGRTELIEGFVVAMAAERIAHSRVKSRAWLALARGIRSAGVECEALPDGVTVEAGEDTDYEPDAVVNCGDLDENGVVATNPVIVVEVSSPSTATFDSIRKLAGYFQVPSIQHYLIVRTDRHFVVHHRRTGATIETRLIYEGTITLDPPGITVAIEDFYEAP